MGQNIVKGNELEVDLPLTKLVAKVMENKSEKMLYLDPKSVNLIDFNKKRLKIQLLLLMDSTMQLCL
jgi:hypothetical protein